MTAMRKIMGGLAVAVAAVTITFVVQSPAHATTARSSVLDVTLPDSTFTLFHTDNSANYKHMDLIQGFTAKRLELAEKLDRGQITEAQSESELSEFSNRIRNEERK